MITKIYKLRRNNIALVQFIIEGYERMATVSTIDSRQALLQVMIMPDFVVEVEGLLDYLETQGMIEEASGDCNDYPVLNRPSFFL